MSGLRPGRAGQHRVGAKQAEYGSVNTLVTSEVGLAADSRESLAVAAGRENVTTFFDDQQRRIDFVLVYSEAAGEEGNGTAAPLRWFCNCWQ